MDFDTGAALVLTYCHLAACAQGLRPPARPGETLVVLGAAGGVGISAIEIGKAMGARVIAAASSDDKLALCRKVGADETVNYSSESLKDRITELTGGKGADVVYDPVGGPYTEPAVRALAWRGRLLIIGFAAGEIPKIPLNLALLKERSLVGVYWGDSTKHDPAGHLANLQQLNDWFSRRQDQARRQRTLSADRGEGCHRRDRQPAGQGQGGGGPARLRPLTHRVAGVPLPRSGCLPPRCRHRHRRPSVARCDGQSPGPARCHHASVSRLRRPG
jgi:NADPH:quinone reductase-like Zn-dependent oxidoreductase